MAAESYKMAGRQRSSGRKCDAFLRDKEAGWVRVRFPSPRGGGEVTGNSVQNIPISDFEEIPDNQP